MSSVRTVKPGEPVTYHTTERQKIDITALRAASSSYLELLALLLVMPEAASVTLHGQEAELALCLWATANSVTMVKGDGFCRVSLRSGTTIESRQPAPAPRVVVDEDARWSPASGQEMP